MRFSKSILLCTFVLLSSVLATAQSGLPQIPEDAFFVSRISGQSLQSKMSIAELDALPVFQSLFKEGMRSAEMNSLNDAGIDFARDAYVFAQANDSITYLTWMIPLADLTQFKSTVLLEMGVQADVMPPHTKNDITVYWNDGAAVFIAGMIDDSYVELHSERLKEQYELAEDDNAMEDFYGYEDEVVPDYEYEIVEPELEEAMDEPIVEMEITEEEAGDWEIVEEEVLEDEYSSGYENTEAYEAYDPYAYDYGYGYNSMSWSQKNQLTQVWQSQWCSTLMSTAGAPVLMQSAAYKKVAASRADASAYFDYGAYVKLMMGEFMGPGMSSFGSMYASMFINMLNVSNGSNLFSELEFGEDQIEWDMVYTATGKAAEMQSAMLDNKLSSKYLKYMNSSDMIGFYTLAFNTEETLKYYADITSYYMGGISGNAEVGEVSSELLQLMIDEEAIAELFPGTAVITFSDFSKRMIEYTTYDYDENWNRTEVIREKEEVLPTFLAMMETERSELVSKILRLAAMEEEMVETDFGFQLNGGPFPIYFFLKGGMLFIGNDLAQVNDIQKGSFKAGLSSVHKKAIKKNNSVIFFDAKELIEDLELEYQSGEIAEMIAFAKGRAERVIITTSKLDDSRTNMKAVIDIPENEANGWSYMMNVFNAYYEMDTGY
jgi:hypothetical protein